MLLSSRHAARSREARPRPAGGAPGHTSGAGRLISVVRPRSQVLWHATIALAVAVFPTWVCRGTSAPSLPTGPSIYEKGVRLAGTQSATHPLGLLTSADRGDVLELSVKDAFFGTGRIEQPSLSFERNGNATLNLRTIPQKGPFLRKAEFDLEVTIRIDKSRLEGVERLFVMNQDMREVVGFLEIPSAHEASESKN